ncbi:MAG: OmpA family protein [Deltaproteobacteria bacterium]|nr:OmpA family protein [Deltaproteobacteria bacterium]
MPNHLPRRLSPSARAVALAIGLSLPGAANAQTGTLNAYVPAPTPDDDFQLSRPTDLGHGRVGAVLTLDYALNPLVWEAELGDAGSEEFSIVEHQLVGTAGLSVGLADRIVLFGGLPVVLAMSGESAGTVSAVGASAADGAGVGDANLGARLRLFGERKDTFALAAQSTITIPTSSGSYSGDDGVSAIPLLTGELRLGGGARLVLLAGTRLRPKSSQSTSNVEYGNELRLGGGVAVPVWEDGTENGSHLDLHGQVLTSAGFRDMFGREETNAEGLVGAKWFSRSGVILGGGLGPGIGRGIGTPDLRAVLSLGWLTPIEPPPRHPCADHPEDLDGFQDGDGCDDPDNDQDGFLDKVDGCPNDPENKNSWQDDDGCPDKIPDTDGDGLLDPADRCPTEPEDRDTFEDEDGCPDPDNDKDTVLDVVDACPMEPGPVDNRGCPDKDRDTDTVIDRRDNCPDVPGLPANYGCPEAEKQAVRIEQTKIEILDTVYFRTDSDVILKKSFSLLDNVASVLKAHPEIARIRVEGHTDSRGKREHNMELSRKRAASVAKYLVDKGLAKERLESEGYGPDRPVVQDAKKPADHAKNRRVVFQIIGSAESVSTTSTGPSSEHIDR